MTNMIQIPNFRFPIGSIITEKEPEGRTEYIIYDVSYSIATGDWYYRYSYWMGGYEHYCKCPIKCVENLFRAIER